MIEYIQTLVKTQEMSDYVYAHMGLIILGSMEKVILVGQLS